MKMRRCGMSESSPNGSGPGPAFAVPQLRRVLALILPDLLVELALQKRLAHAAAPQAEAHRPLGVVLVDEADKPAAPQQLSLSLGGQPLSPEEELPASEPLAAVNREAERFGVRARQSIAEAAALVSQLVIAKVKRVEVERALASLAEVALGYGATVALSAPDVVWVDITGSAHLFGGEEALAQDLAERVRELGHRVKIAVSVGPELAAAFARWPPPARRAQGNAGVCIVPSARTDLAAAELPSQALPLSADDLGYFTRLGLLTCGDLRSLTKSALAPRLGKGA